LPAVAVDSAVAVGAQTCVLDRPGLSITSLLATEYGHRDIPVANFYLAPFRAWGLLVRSLCALHLKNGEVRKLN